MAAKFSIGDRVVLKFKPSVRGVILSARAIPSTPYYNDYEYEVQYDGEYIPPSDTHLQDTLQDERAYDRSVNEFVIGVGDDVDIVPKTCDCGAKKAIGVADYTVGHSDWCKVHHDKSKY